MLVVGTGRSGTTWLAELLNSSGDYQVVFEPFSRRPGHNPVWHDAVVRNPYLRPGARFERHDVVRTILLGGVSNEWVDRLGGDRASPRVLTKDIRLAFMVGWIQRSFPELRIVYIVRDPRSVAYSAAEHGWGEIGLGTYLRRRLMIDDHLTPAQLSTVRAADGLFAKSLAKWAIENQVILRTLRPGPRATSIYYERLATDPQSELDRLARFCGHRVAAEPAQHARRRSATTWRGTVTDPARTDFNSRWRGAISTADQAYAQRVLEVFGLDALYAEPGLPAFEEPMQLRR